MSDIKQDQVKVDKSLDNMRGKLVTGRNGVQLHILNVLIHAEKHNDMEGNARKVIETLDEMGMSQYSEAVILWFGKYAGYFFTEDGGQKSWSGAKFVRAHFEEAKANKFWTMVKLKNAFKGMDFVAEVANVVSKANKMMAKDLSEEDSLKVVIDLDKFRAVKEALAA